MGLLSASRVVTDISSGDLDAGQRPKAITASGALLASFCVMKPKSRQPKQRYDWRTRDVRFVGVWIECSRLWVQAPVRQDSDP